MRAGLLQTGCEQKKQIHFALGEKMTSEGKRRYGEAIISIFFLLRLFSSPDFAMATSDTVTIPAFPAGKTPEYSVAYNDFARFIAGMEVGQGPLAKLQSRPAWADYARFFDQSWEKLDKKQFTPIRQWAERELGAAASSSNTVFYPFSGPDFANAYAFFAQARTYVLVGLEPLGEIPDFAAMSDAQFDSYFIEMKKSLADLLNIDYFISAHMRAELQKTEIKGVLPVLLFMAARNNAQVLDVRYWVMKPDGTVREFPALEAPDLDPGSVRGVRITFEAAGAQEGRPKTLYYFRLNLYNQSFEKNGHFLAFLKGLAPLTTFMKSASYVMHDPHVSVARQFVLEQSRYVVQEDSGIPVKYFDPALWNIRFYGVYARPISIFSRDYQEDLAAIYNADKNIKPLPFGFGYHFKTGEANLMFAEKKSVR
jgi:hypothetical protein